MGSMGCMCVTDQQHGLFTEQLLLQHLQVSLLLLQLTSDIILSITGKKNKQMCKWASTECKYNVQQSAL